MADQIPPQVPLIRYTSPVISDRVLVEIWTAEAASASPLQYGQNHPNTKLYPGFIYIRDVPVEGNVYWVHRYWTSLNSAQDTYNYDIHYSGEASSYPIYEREYEFLRATYAPLTYGSKMTGVMRVQVTASGTGYDSTTTVTFTGGGGAGAAANAVVFRGTVVAIAMTAEGTGYTSAPTVTINGIGAAATATSFIQNSNAILTKQELVREKNEPDDSMFIIVKATYETLPGPVIIEYDVDDETQQQIIISKQRIAKPSAGTVAGLNSAGVLVKYFPENNVVGTLVTLTSGTPTGRTETHLAPYTFPGLVTSLNAQFVEARNGWTKIATNATTNTAARVRVVPHQTVISYGSYAALAAAVPTYLKLGMANINYDGIFMQVHANNVLIDNGSNAALVTTYTTGSNNPIWPLVTETLTLQPTVPTATQYAALVLAGAWNVISYALKPWKYNLWRLESVEIVLE